MITVDIFICCLFASKLDFFWCRLRVEIIFLSVSSEAVTWVRVSSTSLTSSTRLSAMTSCYPSTKKQRSRLQRVSLFWTGDRMQSSVLVSQASCILPVKVFCKVGARPFCNVFPMSLIASTAYKNMQCSTDSYFPWRGANYCDQQDCASVCPLAYLKNHISKLKEIILPCPVLSVWLQCVTAAFSQQHLCNEHIFNNHHCLSLSFCIGHKPCHLQRSLAVEAKGWSLLSSSALFAAVFQL